MDEEDRAVRARVWHLVPVMGLLLFALVLRAPVTVVPPVLSQMRVDLGLGAASAGLLTSIPVLCFGLFTPVASLLLWRTGINHGVLYCFLGILAGSVIRSAGGFTSALLGTTLIGLGLAIGNLAAPMLIGRQFQHRAHLMTGAYSATVNLGATVSTGLAVPLAAVAGWRWAIALCGLVLGTVSLVGWLVVFPPGAQGVRPRLRILAGLPEPQPSGIGTRTNPSPLRGPLRRTAWLVAAAFGLHSLAWYSVASWLPTALTELDAMSPSQAGWAASAFQITGVVGPFLVPLISRLSRWSPLAQLTAAAGGWVVLPAGMLLAPSLWLVWSLVTGLTQGAFFTLLFLALIQRSRTVDENRQTSTLMQTVGYSIAATGPVITGWIHQQLAGWTAPFAFVLAVVILAGLFATTAARSPIERPGSTP